MWRFVEMFMHKWVCQFLIATSIVVALLMPFAVADPACWNFINTNQSACQSAFNSSCSWLSGSDPGCPETTGCCAPKGCWDYTTQSDCTSIPSLGCTWESDQYGSWCEKRDCFSADSTNQTYCEATLNQSYGIECVWTAGSNLCDPPLGHLSSCSEYNNNSVECLDTGYCEWNSNTGACNDPAFGGYNPSCSVFSQQSECQKITGCSWSNNACTGNTEGIGCADITNKTMCNGIPVLSTCCTWSNNTCGSTISGSCWDNLQPTPTGAEFCEDYNSYSNQTLCNQIAGSPWYMPCAWNNVSDKCQFNGQDTFQGFDDINSKSNCEAAGGLWRSETYTSGGITKTDEWCEFNVGSSGNCKSSCWACEKQDDGSAWGSLANAQSACENSDTGFCSFTANSNSPNGYGYCDPVQQFFFGGGSCDSNCKDCNFMNSPQTACNNSPASCKWVTDQADSSIGWCEKEAAKTCADDCFSCYDENTCENYGRGGNQSCEWDGNGYFCKTFGFTGEICFDGADNDGDSLVDCADPGCGFDSFCGGQFLGDCGAYSSQNQSACEAVNTTFGNCVWVQEDGGHSWCGMPGEQCWMNDDNQTSCNAETGCGWDTGNGGFCEVNLTQEDSCGLHGTNQTSCTADSNCAFRPDPFGGGGGWCDHKSWECEWNASLQISQVLCEGNTNCMWDSEESGYYAPCQPKCFSYDDNQTGCNAQSDCGWVDGLCEPDFFMGDCPTYDNNQTGCQANSQCVWSAPYCENSFVAQMFNDMQGGPPLMLGSDADDGVQQFIEIMGFGIKDMGSAYGMGIPVESLADAGMCNGYQLQEGGTGSGTKTSKFYWYVDTNGVETGGCSAIGTAQNYSGFEFLYAYDALYSSSLTESRVAYRCLNSSWAPANIPLSGSSAKMCGEIGGAMVGVNKEGMEKFSNLINDTAKMRFFVSSANGTTTRLAPIDDVGPLYFKPGSVDFAFEDCSAVGNDLDGDGLSAENDPDCFAFFRLGFVPIESGPQCIDDVDNDNDGKTDCLDSGCKSDSFFCSGNLSYDANDKDSPSVVWIKKELYPDAAVIMFDTDEPSNGTLLFYKQDSTCTTLNKTIKDQGLLDSFIPEFKQWHDVPIDNFAFNSQRTGYSMQNASNYYFKIKNCDPSGNCALSKCLNFTTKNNANDCSTCRATVKFNYSAPSGGQVTDPLGNIDFKIILPNGTEQTIGDTALSLNYTDAYNTSVELSNPNSTDQWKIKFNGVTLKKLSQTTQNLGTSDVKYNTSNNNAYVGMGDNKCQALLQELRPKTLDICVPGNNTDLWHCDGGLDTCANKTSGAVKIGYNSTQENTCWRVPADWGC